MCKTPKAPKVEIPDPVILRNPFLDATRSPEGVAAALRTGRSALRIPLGSSASSSVFTNRTGNANQPGGTSGARGNAGRTTRGRSLTTVDPAARPVN